MLRFLPLLLLALAAFDCTRPAPPAVALVPADALAGLLPDSVGVYSATGDEVYRGYFADTAGAVALVTVARTFMAGAAMMTLNVSSMDDPARYRAIVEAGGGRPASDSTIAADAALRAATAAGWTAYGVQYGWLLVHPAGRAVEAKSLFAGIAQEALAQVDLARLSALPVAEVVVDETFVRAVPSPAPAEAPAPARDTETIG